MINEKAVNRKLLLTAFEKLTFLKLFLQTSGELFHHFVGDRFDVGG